MISKILNAFRRKKVKAKMYMMDGDEIVQVDVIKPVKIPEPKKKKRNRKTLTREEMWEIMCDHYEIFKSFRLHPQNMGDEYIHREKLWNFFVATGLNKSSRLTETQREKIKQEIVNRL